jgi:hypothetical protein
VVIQFVDSLKEDCWALQFPANIDTTGRRLLHDVANFFDFAHHSQGKKKRCMMMYPRSQFVSRQKTELKRLNKEAAKIQNKLLYREKEGVDMSNCPKSFHLKIVQEQYEQRIAVHDHKKGPEGKPIIATHVLSEDLPPFV